MSIPLFKLNANNQSERLSPKRITLLMQNPYSHILKGSIRGSVWTL